MNLGGMIGDVEREIAEEDRREAPRRARREKVRQESPRVIYRDNGRSVLGNLRPSYAALRLADVRYSPRHVEKFHYFGDRKEHKRTRPPEIHVQNHVYPADRIGEFVRRPTAKALRRLEEAEAELARARQAVKDATRAAFTYGKPVSLSAVQDVTRRMKEAWGEE